MSTSLNASENFATAPKGFFGPYGGQYVPDSALPVLTQLEDAFKHYSKDPAFVAELEVGLSGTDSHAANHVFG